MSNVVAVEDATAENPAAEAEVNPEPATDAPDGTDVDEGL